jgi:hypothetical protein
MYQKVDEKKRKLGINIFKVYYNSNINFYNLYIIQNKIQYIWHSTFFGFMLKPCIDLFHSCHPPILLLLTYITIFIYTNKKKIK